MNNNNDKKYNVAIAGILAVAAIECVNLLTAGVDSAVTTAIIGAITGIAGWVLGKRT